MTATREIPGTTLFDGRQARKGYALNKMCFSFNDAANRAEFVKDEAAYCTKYGLTGEQTEALRKRDILKLLAFGDSVNVTLGLPIIRTSVDHGTAFDIAGKGVADHSSLVAAIRLAAQLARP